MSNVLLVFFYSAKYLHSCSFNNTSTDITYGDQLNQQQQLLKLCTKKMTTNWSVLKNNPIIKPFYHIILEKYYSFEVNSRYSWFHRTHWINIWKKLQTLQMCWTKHYYFLYYKSKPNQPVCYSNNKEYILTSLYQCQLQFWYQNIKCICNWLKHIYLWLFLDPIISKFVYCCFKIEPLIISKNTFSPILRMRCIFIAINLFRTINPLIDFICPNYRY